MLADCLRGDAVGATEAAETGDEEALLERRGGAVADGDASGAPPAGEPGRSLLLRSPRLAGSRASRGGPSIRTRPKLTALAVDFACPAARRLAAKSQVGAFTAEAAPAEPEAEILLVRLVPCSRGSGCPSRPSGFCPTIKAEPLGRLWSVAGRGLSSRGQAASGVALSLPSLAFFS